ncbi:nuclear transport factor 2 family protein [Streptomyces sp. GMR22]|uniref:nuclear transport factor 2 family protein n=1 Tax=Streptomyces sp. GMR22 TaxID=2759524 RepID=UPI001F39E4DA|nr:nuclear transport factor 2 family protein [Streptomyces sp. GMR22]
MSGTDLVGVPDIPIPSPTTPQEKTMQNIQRFAEEYFEAAVDPNRERYFSLFGDDVVVHDDGRSHHGLTAVRRWRAEVPSVRYDLREVTGTATACKAVAAVSGDFPGSPVTLRFAFTRDVRGKITQLDIEP